MYLRTITKFKEGEKENKMGLKPAVCSIISLLILCIVLSGALNAVPVSGVISLTVDATDAPRKILHATETIPVRSGQLKLAYAKWIPGEHGPTGPIVDLAGLVISASGKPIRWFRDPVDMYQIRLDVPAGVQTIDLAFDFLLAPNAEGFSSGASSSSQLAVVSWNQVVWYSADLLPDKIVVAPSIRVPAGWQFGTALEVKEPAGETVHFATVSLTTLVDSPVLMGAHFRKIDLAPGSGVSHSIAIAAEYEEDLAMTAEQLEGSKRLITEANALFGARHYNHYVFLVTLSDQVAHFGLEHHQCSDDRMPERTLVDNDPRRAWASLLPHEYAHSWNGKYRRPDGLATNDFTKPMKGDLLWVYEGLDQYLGKILTARCGLRNAADFREDLALLAARLDHLPGRQWRTLQDDAIAAQILYGAREDWQSLRRPCDFYDESALIWLEADVTIRKMSQGKKSLDDFCRSFFGGTDSPPMMKPYSFENLIASLNSVVPFDWRTFFQMRLESLDAHAPLGGIEQSGWKLVYRESPDSLQMAIESTDKQIDARYSLGILLKEDGTMMDVIPGSPAALAGMAPGMKLMAVDDRKITKETFRSTMKGARSTTVPMELLATNGDIFKTYAVNYHGGERYPNLDRDTSKTDLLGEIIRPIAVK
jgi:predicted metalloprotease with PDZ domain